LSAPSQRVSFLGRLYQDHRVAGYGIAKLTTRHFRIRERFAGASVRAFRSLSVAVAAMVS
jgi:hypothetical protein